MSVNSNRTIDIQTTYKDSTSKTSVSWRSLLSEFLNAAGKGTGMQPFLNDSTLLEPVNSNVILPLTDVPGLSGKYDTNEPLKSVIGGIKTGTDSTLKTIDTLFDKSLSTKVAIASKAITLGYSAITKNIFSPWWTSVPAYNTGAVSKPNIKLNFDFTLGQFGLWNATEEVVKPILNLTAPVMLRNLTDLGYMAPFPNSTLLVRDIFENIMNWLLSLGNKKEEGKSEADSDSTFVSSTVFAIYDKYTYTISFGNFAVYYHMILKSAESSFSNKVDDKGMPVSGTATLEFESIMPLSASAKASDALTVRYGKA